MNSYLNLGCGRRFDASWTNIDFVSSGIGVLAHDLRRGIPFDGGKFDVVYNSHVLEHFSKPDGLIFIRECHRVLRSGGIIRIAVPDLETIARLYIQSLEKVSAGETQWEHHYKWIKLEMYDQTVRECSGGEMASYLSQSHIANRKFVLERMGLEGRHYLDKASGVIPGPDNIAPQMQKSILSQKMRTLYFTLRHPAVFRERLIQRFLGDEYGMLQLGRFRRGGEVHLWMYDRYSLEQLLKSSGFEQCKVAGPRESLIPNWTDYNLDTEADGTVYKPDSLYMEAVKP